MLDYSIYSPPDWLKTTSPNSSPYFPQVGDIVTQATIQSPICHHCPHCVGRLFSSGPRSLRQGSQGRTFVSMETTEDAVATISFDATRVMSG